MKARTLIQLCGKDAEAFVHQGRQKFNYLFCFWLCLLFCKLLWNGFNELVPMMERDLGCLIDNLYEECESQFLETIGGELSKEQKDVDNEKLYEAS
jgi:hypothetical protein